MASDLLQNSKTSASSHNEADRLATQRMRKDFQFRFSALVLAFITMAAVIFAGINAWKERQNPLPDDGVACVEHGEILLSHGINSGSAGDLAGIKTGDQLFSLA